MGRIATELADVAIVTSDNPRSEDPQAIIEEVLAGTVGEPEVEPDRRAAIERAIELAEPGDVVVIAGKGHEQGRRSPAASRPSTTGTWRATRSGPCGPPRDPAHAGGGGGARARPARGRAVGGPGHRLEDGLASRRGRRPLRRRRRGRRLRQARLRRGAAATLVPDDAFAALAALAGAVRDRSSALRRDHRLDGQDLDEGHPRRDLRAAAQDRRRRAQLQRRDRRAADDRAGRARHGALHPRARDARLRADRRAVRVRPARRRRDHERRPGAPGEGRRPRRRHAREERADRRAASRAARRSSRPASPSSGTTSRSCGSART